MQIVKLERKRMQWKVDIRQGLQKAKLKAALYYGKTENPQGLLCGIGACLNPYCKLNLFREWDFDDVTGETEYEKSYKKAFIAYYDHHYEPKNAPGAETPIPRNGLNSRLKHLHGSRPRASVVSEALVYIESDSDIEPPEPLTDDIDPGHNPSPAGFFTRQIYWTGGRLMQEGFLTWLGWLGMFLQFREAVLKWSEYLAWQEM